MNESKLKQQCHEVTPLDEAKLDASVPDRVRIAPWGEVNSTRGRFVVDEESAELVIAAFGEHGADLPIDYEHQSLGGPYAAPSGQAPAAGWIKCLEAEPGVGLFATVAWTEPARAQLAAKQYRYLSPVALIRASDRKLVALHSVALTNKPAMVGAEPIVNREATPNASVEALRERLSLEGEANVETVLLAASERIDALEHELSRKRFTDQIDEAVRGGRITEAQRDFAVRLALRDTALFEEWIDNAPQVVPLGRTEAPDITENNGARHGVAALARAEFRAHPELAALTSEEAYVAAALRN